MNKSRIIPLFISAIALLFLYAPIIALVVYSFNASKRVTIWGGFSVKWYGRLFENEEVLIAAFKSLQIALASASLGTFFGVAGAFAMVRLGRFWLRPLLSSALTAPLVMPEVITGLSLLLLFIAMEQSLGWPQGRGMMTIIIAHATFCTAYVSVVVMSRLAHANRSIEEAALDLGAHPVRVFWDITLPTIMPSVIAGWLLAFTLSLDDLVIASFVSGPSSSTLPMVVFSKVKFGVSPEINALATLVMLVVALSLATAWIFLRRKKE